MNDPSERSPKAKTGFRSSVAEDVWHDLGGEKAYEWWYFDALSDDGTDAVAITFSDNYVFSPAYAEPFADSTSIAPQQGRPLGRSPAVTFLYWSGGKALVRNVAQYSISEFSASREQPECRIGESYFRSDSARYGSGYIVHIDLSLLNGRRAVATFEWLSLESDLLPDREPEAGDLTWNMVAARSDVSGRIELMDSHGRCEKTAHFRGTGYHDHVTGTDPLYEAVSCRQWGRVHFGDVSAIYSERKAGDGEQTNSRLVITKDGGMTVHDARLRPHQMHRDRFGIKYPKSLDILTDSDARLHIEVQSTIESTFYNVRFLSEMTLTLGDGKERKTVGLTEILSPANMKYRLFRWFTEIQLARKGIRPES